MFLKLNKKLKKHILNLIAIDDLMHLIDSRKVAKCVEQATMGANSTFYPEATVQNLASDAKKILIGTGTHIRGELTVWPYGDGIVIGDDSFIGTNSVIRAAHKIDIGNNVLIAHNVTIIDSDSHEINHLERAQSYKLMITKGHPTEKGNVKTSPIKIHDYVWISYNVCILKGVEIGEGAVVAAGSVVNRDVLPYTLVAGNPAKIIRELE